MPRRVRLPVANTYNTRSGASNSSPSASGYVGMGIVGTMIVGSAASSSRKDAKQRNCFVHVVVDPLAGGAKAYLIKRPGWSVSNTPQSGSVGSAILAWSGQGAGTKVITAFGSTNSSIYDGTTRLTTNAADTTAITGKATSITETVVTTTPTIVISSSDNTAWSYADGGTVTKISDADFPGNAGYTLAGGFVHMDGYACIMTSDGKLWASDLNSVTAWTATSFDSANAYPDRGIGAVRHKNTILCFGTESVQVFYNAGTTPFPFAKSNAATIKIGAVSANAIGQISDTVFFAGSTPQGGLSIYRYDGSVARISTPEIDSQLIVAGASSIYLSTLRFYGLSFVLVISGTTTFAYCLEDQAWHEWTGNATLWQRCAGISVGDSLVTYAVSTTSTSGKVYTINPASLVYTDDSAAYTATVQLANYDAGTEDRKFCQELALIADTESTSSPVTLSWSDDDYNTFKTWGDIDLSATRKVARRLGSFRRRAFILTHSAATPFRLEALELTLDGGTS